MLVLAGAPTIQFAFPISIGVGWASILFLTASTAIVQMRCDPSMRGRVLALQAIVFLGTTPVGGPIVGALSDVLGPRAALALGGIAALGAGCYGLIKSTRSLGALP